MNFRREAALALEEDRAENDITVQFFIPRLARGMARLVAKDRGVVAGVGAAAGIFKRQDPRLRVRAAVKDGRAVAPGQTLLTARGALASLLSAERSALNILSHLSGIATLTRAYVRAAGPGAKILDTRKTLPGLRDLQKYAVRCGGGVNHRRDLSDAFLIKENHMALLRRNPGDFRTRVKAARRRGRVSMECQSRADVRLGLAAGADILLLDNFSPRALRALVREIRGECRRRGRRPPVLEATGGVTLKTVRAIARSGVDRISVGRLTHSAPAMDVGMDVTPE